MDHGAAGGLRPKFVMRWEASSLNRLPDVLELPLHAARTRAGATKPNTNAVFFGNGERMEKRLLLWLGMKVSKGNQLAIINHH
jgi:hypothetical protein